jgi:hypothetical protein
MNPPAARKITVRNLFMKISGNAKNFSKKNIRLK